MKHFYPRPPRGGRLLSTLLSMRIASFLSTPSARRATIFIRSGMALLLFLSTPSARRATSSRKQAAWFRNYFYPRPPRGGRPPLWRSLRASAKISIHALREEGDGITAVDFRGIAKFLSTPSARRATVTQRHFPCLHAISIHALREEGDVPRFEGLPSN